jgi:uncharacterized protein (TIGR00730 family)
MSLALRSLCVFCGSSAGTDPAFGDAARRLGRALANEGVSLIYGGGRIGLMGQLAEATLDAGGTVVGIIPRHLRTTEVAFERVSELVVVDDMHTRKRAMFDRSDAFCILPGGIGTLDETFEILTWKQLRLHHKPVILVNVAGYWSPWIDLIDHMVAEGFSGAATTSLYTVITDVESVLATARAAPLPDYVSESRLF